MRTLLFVCEHGSAKSVVAAAHCNRMAAERGLDVRAISRGTSPDAENHPAAVAGLGADRLAPVDRPRRLSSSDLEVAVRVVAFSELPAEHAASVRVEVWTVPPVSEGYEAARDAIVGRLERLLEELARAPVASAAGSDDGVPFACDLTRLSALQREREKSLLAQFRALALRAEESETGWRFFVPATQEALGAVGELLALERLCCPFLRFALEVGPGELAAVHIHGHEGVKAFVAAELMG
jgi:protein-tyrosine-phosphatase